MGAGQGNSHTCIDKGDYGHYGRISLNFAVITTE
jgi:hypothetical protein